MIRFDDKATRTERHLEDKMAAFQEIWDMVIDLRKSLYLIGSAVCIDEQLLAFGGRCGCCNICRKNQASMESKFELCVIVPRNA